ncbi:hypothetical protein QQS21_006630 [Conoideocrella luteorostrata]|uniref:Geranylgeranyl pyrophosphate synthetase n=1 Tax=Conoideocrella luteorostrata TaxID=1105319 RepID=A0AAJ0CQ70_9HYPO|nr:hypothetical protein QQS21_006630 [Conoideocrella luteorostrata]
MASKTTRVVISRLHLQNMKFPHHASVTEVEHLSSYNWLDKDTPTIAVPGSPSLWAPPKGPQQLTKDSGHVYISQNAGRLPETPMEPLFRALHVTKPSFDMASIDVVTDRNNMRKLLSYVSSGLGGDPLEPFVIRLEMAKDTLLMCRHDTATVQYIRPNEHRGFGHAFEKAYTEDQISGSSGHHRIISYRFCDLAFIVRHETDGYVADHTAESGRDYPDDDDRGLSNMLGSLALSPDDASPSATPLGSELAVQKMGQQIPLGSTLEIKTRSRFKRLEVRDLAPQLWVSQTPKLVVAYHKRGMFEPPMVVKDVALEIRKWETANQEHLGTLGALIGKIIAVTKDCGGQALLKYDNKRDELVISKEERGKMLPDDLYEKWNGKSD